MKDIFLLESTTYNNLCQYWFPHINNNQFSNLDASQRLALLVRNFPRQTVKFLVRFNQSISQSISQSILHIGAVSKINDKPMVKYIYKWISDNILKIIINRSGYQYSGAMMFELFISV